MRSPGSSPWPSHGWCSSRVGRLRDGHRRGVVCHRGRATGLRGRPGGSRRCSSRRPRHRALADPGVWSTPRPKSSTGGSVSSAARPRSNTVLIISGNRIAARIRCTVQVCDRPAGGGRRRDRGPRRSRACRSRRAGCGARPPARTMSCSRRGSDATPIRRPRQARACLAVTRWTVQSMRCVRTTRHSISHPRLDRLLIRHLTWSIHSHPACRLAPGGAGRATPALLRQVAARVTLVAESR